MKRILLRRAAATLLIGGLTAVVLAPAPAAAQAGGVGAVRVRDTVVLRGTLAPRAAIESIMILMRALDQQSAGSPEQLALSRQIDSLAASSMLMNRMIVTGGGRGAAPQGWIGINVQGPAVGAARRGNDVVYLGYPSIVSVEPASPAQRAGIVPGDVLVAYDGVDLLNHSVDLGQVLRPEKPVVVTVRRDGEMKDYSMVVARTPQDIMRRRGDFASVVVDGHAPASGQGVMFKGPSPSAGFIVMSNGANSIFGMTLASVNTDLGRALKLDTGVLITDAPESSPGYRAGLRTGDVIVSVDGDTTSSFNQFRRLVLLHSAVRSVDMQVVRDKKTRKITLNW